MYLLPVLLIGAQLAAWPPPPPPPPPRRPPPPPRPRRWQPPKPPKPSALQGKAVVYPEDHEGITASGDRYRPRKRRAAHRDLPLGTKLLVTCPATGRSVRVVVNDRGPEDPSALLEITPKVAKRLHVWGLPPQVVHIETVGCKKKYGECD